MTNHELSEYKINKLGIIEMDLGTELFYINGIGSFADEYLDLDELYEPDNTDFDYYQLMEMYLDMTFLAINQVN